MSQVKAESSKASSSAEQPSTSAPDAQCLNPAAKGKKSKRLATSPVRSDQQIVEPSRRSDKPKSKSKPKPRSKAGKQSGLVNGAATHKYFLRSQGRAPADCEEPLTREPRPSSALGASTSHNSKGEDAEPSRLTRRGAVLRSSTRQSKCEYACHCQNLRHFF